MDALNIDCATTEAKTRPLTSAEATQREKDAAAVQQRAAATDTAAKNRQALADKAKAGTLTATEQQQALALLLGR